MATELLRFQFASPLTRPQIDKLKAVTGMRIGDVDNPSKDTPGQGRFGGNVEGVPVDGTVVVDDGVTVVGAGRLASAMAPAASAAYARNLSALTAHLVRDGAPVVDLADDIVGAITVTHEGSVR